MPAASPAKGAKRSRREDTLGATSHEPTLNALTKTPLVHPRKNKKERWLDHARAMIDGKSLAKTAELCGVHPTTAYRWRHRFLRAPER